VTNDDRVRLLVIGAGRMGQVHLRAIESSRSVLAAAVVEPVDAVRSMLDGTGAALFADVVDALAAAPSLGIDAALIAAPSPQHPDLVARTIAAGLPTLCEKPLGLRSADTALAAERAAAAGVPLQVGYWRRFVPGLRTVRDEIASGALGAIALVQAWQWDAEPPAASFRRTSGGPLADMGVHEFDMLRWLTGQEVTITAVVDSVVNSVEPVAGDPESLLAVGSLSGGGVAAISLGRRFDRGDCCWVEVIGTRGSRRCEFMIGDAGDAVFRAALVAQLDAFASLVRGGRSHAATAADAVAALRCVEAAGGLSG
jgi:myo-inositol 2-dehydrogenase / D-chiro-inositol 1-dehydrogenase